MAAATAEELQKYGEVLVITTQAGLGENCHSQDNLEICRLRPKNIYYLLDGHLKNFWQKIIWHLWDLFNWPVLRQVENKLKVFQPDLVFTHNLKGLSLGVPKILRKLRLKQVHVLHDYQLLDPHGSFYRSGRAADLIGWPYCFYRLLTKRAFRQPWLVISPSKFVLDKHLVFGFFKSAPAAVLPNPVSLPEVDFTRAPRSNVLRLLYLGQIEQHKGVDFLIKAFQAWAEPKSQLTIAGTGAQLLAIKKLSAGQSKIIVVGQVERDQIPQLFKETDLLVVPSIWWENSPSVIYEAYSYQVPVLVSDAGGAKELVKNGQTGWIFKSLNQEDLIDKFKKARGGNLSALGQNGYALVKNFSADKYVAKLLKLARI